MRSPRRNRKPYLLDIGGGRHFDLTAAEFAELRAGGWIIPDGKTAKLRAGVITRIRGCDLFLFSTARLQTVCQSWDYAWFFHVGQVRGKAVVENWEEREARVMRERDEELFVDAFLWRTERGKKRKGANELRWVDPEHKAEVLRALKPEMLQSP